MLSAGLRGRMSKVPKFSLARDFAMAADEFGIDTNNLDKVISLARLPYPECWFEVAQADRAYFNVAPLEPGDSRISRAGFLCTQLDQHSWSAILFWSYAAGETFAGHMLPPVPSDFMLVVDTKKSEAVEATSFRKADGVSLFSSPNMSDWTGEPGFLIATLALLNSRNAAETQVVVANNKRRRLLRKPLLFDYHLINIPQRYRQRHHLDDDTDPAELRAHFVRGHFKVRKSGIFWWSAYQRGNAKLGFVHHDYRLRLSA